MKIPIRQYWRLFSSYLQPHRRKVALLAVLLLSSIGLQLLNPQILRFFIDTATAGGAFTDLVKAALVYLVVGLSNQLLSAFAAYVGQDVAWSATNTMRSDLARHCLRLDMAFHKVHPPGELIERIDGDVNALANFFSQLVIRVFGSMVLLVGVLFMLYREEVRLGLALSVFALLALFVLARIRNLAVPHVTADREANADLYGFLEERLSGAEDIKANGAVAYVMRQFDALLLNLYHKGRKAWLFGAMPWPVTGILFALGYAVSLGVGAILYLNGSITLGTVFLIFNYTELLRQPIEELARQMEELQKAGGSIARIEELRQVQPTIAAESSSRGRRPLPAEALAVRFERVSFAYNDESVAMLKVKPAAAGVKPNGSQNGSDDDVAKTRAMAPHTADVVDLVLDRIDFELAPGKVMGLLGRTGSGKTTLSRLLFRFYDPTFGAIRLNGVDLQQIPLHELQNHIGLVTQDVQLFHGAVRDNITFFDRSVSDEQIMQVIDDLGLHAWFESLADGLDTPITSDGAGLSAGEAQLLAFTRVFLKRPGLVILDEASSRLDPLTEQLIERAVDRLLQNRTGIIIAHRLGTVQRADDILILEQGRVREYGRRRDLVQDPDSRFSQLLRTGMTEALA